MASDSKHNKQKIAINTQYLLLPIKIGLGHTMGTLGIGPSNK